MVYFLLIGATRWLHRPAVLTLCIGGPALALAILDTLFGSLPRYIQHFGAPTYVAFCAPGLAVAVSLPCAIAAGLQMLADRDAGMTEQILAAPLSLFAVLAGILLGACSQALLGAAATVATAEMLGFWPGHGLISLATLVPITLCLTAIFGSCSIGMATAWSTTKVMRPLAAVVVAGTILASCLALPKDVLPPWLVAVSHINPLTYAVDAARAGEGSRAAWTQYVHDLLVLVGASAGTGALAAVLVASSEDGRLRFADR